ncbi:PTS system, ascorbate-specific IIB component [Gracilibacillus orientalis]|uniref:PTS system, ascorbate-specific IIB component n=1 Tax=Gracilibacillus orientalis TaxID=334253 RepID=A0A1I4HSF1_9BACI|nr:PTS sugar transporter subunit IIB [Gracilibacillus orientalis]SFL44501.1 PTS system, ascorbate-specific IIB component [Gracilibacillus orientalis]
MKILAVCGMGFGSSMMLKMTVEQVLKELNQVADVETADFSTAASLPADLIVTNEEFAKQLDDGSKPVIAIENIADSQEVKEKLIVYVG